MKVSFWQRWTLGAMVIAAVLSGCGSGSIVSPFQPTRIVVLGDGMSDVGQLGTTRRYTVNDSSSNNWALEFAVGYGLTVSPQASGGQGYAQGNARITSAVDAAGGSAPSVTQQVSTYLAQGTPLAGDLILINGGAGDVVAQMTAYKSGAITEAAMAVAVAQAGTELGKQIRRLVNAGAQRVVIAGMPNLSKTPWATAIGETVRLSSLSIALNDALLSEVWDMGTHVFFVDMAYYVNIVTAAPANTLGAGAVATTPVCTSADAATTNGIGTGVGQVNSSLCTTTTLISGANHNVYVFADALHFTPAMHRLMAAYARLKVLSRW
jgi:outer membrane lipase/esterase